MPNELPPIRRLITENGPDGRSRFAEDGLAPAVRTVAARPGYRVTNLWVTQDTPAPIDAPDASEAHKGILPPKNGTIVRIIDYPPEPEDPAAFEAMVHASFGSLYGDLRDRHGKADHPSMHVTETVDYAIVVYGEIDAVLDDGERRMRTGDVLIQRGTNHAWRNRSGKMCRMAFILIDGKNG